MTISKGFPVFKVVSLKDGGKHTEESPHPGLPSNYGSCDIPYISSLDDISSFLGRYI